MVLSRRGRDLHLLLADKGLLVPGVAAVVRQGLLGPVAPRADLRGSLPVLRVGPPSRGCLLDHYPRGFPLGHHHLPAPHLGLLRPAPHLAVPVGLDKGASSKLPEPSPVELNLSPLGTLLSVLH